MITLALALRIPWLGQSFWLDETLTGAIINRPSFGFMSEPIVNQAEGPVYFYAVWAWRYVFGAGEVGLRLFSLLASVATIPVVYAAIARLMNRRAGVAAAGMLAVSPLFLWYSVEARAYALWILLSAFALLFWARALERDSPGWAFDGWALTSALALGTHYFAVGLIVPQAVWLVLRPASRRQALRAIAMVGVAGLMLVTVVEYQRIHGGSEFISMTPLSKRLDDAARSFTDGPGRPGDLVEVAIPALCFMALILALCLDRGRLRRGVLAIAGLTAASVVMAFVGRNYLLTRNLLFLLPLLAALAGSVAGLRGRASIVGGVIAAAICVLFLWQDLHHWDMFQRDDWRAIARAIGPPRRDRLVLLAPQFDQAAIGYYSPGLSPVDGLRTAREIDWVVSLTGNPWPHDPLRPSKPPAHFKQVGRATWHRLAIGMARYRADQPRVVDARSLQTQGQAGAVVLGWAP